MTRLGFVKIHVGDLDRMALFFVEAFGAREVARITIDDVDEVLLTLSGNAPEIALMRRHLGVPFSPGTMHGPVGLLVDSCDKVAESCLSAGGSQRIAPTTLADAGIRVAFMASPEGHELEFVETLSAG